MLSLNVTDDFNLFYTMYFIKCADVSCNQQTVHWFKYLHANLLNYASSATCNIQLRSK